MNNSDEPERLVLLTMAPSPDSWKHGQIRMMCDMKCLDETLQLLIDSGDIESTTAGVSRRSVYTITRRGLSRVKRIKARWPKSFRNLP